MEHIITTVGASIFSNFLKKEIIRAYGKDKHLSIFQKSSLDFFENKSASEYSKEDFENIEESLKEYWLIGTNKNGKIWSKWQNDSTIKNTNASAEIKSICKIIEESEDTEFNVYLLCSDTAIGMSAGHLVKAFFEGYSVEGKTITIELLEHTKGLQIDNADKFEDDAVLDLITKINTITKWDDAKNALPKEDIILNISGGYKALVPIMTIVGQLQGIQLKYIYEDSDNLITIGNLPINFDWDVIDDNYTAFEGIKSSKNDSNLSSLNVFKNEISKEYTFEELEQDYKLVYVFEKEGCKKVKETILGRILHITYDSLYEQGKMVRNNLLSNLVELKIFEFFAKNYKTICGHKINGFDADIFVETKDWIKIIEVKPASNIPIWDSKKSKQQKRKNSIEKNSYEGAFKQAKNKYSNKTVSPELFIYGHNEPHYRAIEKLLKLKEKENNPCKDLKIVWLKLESNYKTNTEWKVQSRLKLFVNYNNQSKKIEWKNYWID